MKVRASVVIATFNKPTILAKVLASIRAQQPPFRFEVIVADDGSDDNEATKWTCRRYEVEKYIRIDRGMPPDYRNPGPARNLACRAARGDVLVMQSDDVIHKSPDMIQQLVERLQPGEMRFAKVYNRKVDDSGREFGRTEIYTGRANPRPLFFLGSLYRRDLYAVGGNDEDFTEPGFEDDWLGLCLTRGLGLTPVFDDDLLAVHHHHPRPRLTGFYQRMQVIHDAKVAAAEQGEIPWCARGGPWSYIEGEPCPCPNALS